jgi:hypothetical protein
VSLRAAISPYFSFGSLFFPMVGFYLVFVIGEIFYYQSIDALPDHFAQAMTDQIIALSIGSLLFVLLELQRRRQNVRGNLSADDTEDWRVSPRRVGVITASVAAILLAIGILKGINPLSNPLGFRQLIQGGGVAYLLFLFLFLLKVFGVSYFDAFHLRRLRRIDSLLAAGLMGFCLISGFTSLFIYFFFAGWVYLSVRYRVRIVRWYTILGFGLLLLFTPFYTLYRELAKAGVEIDAETIEQYLGRIQVNAVKVVFDRFDYFVNMISGSYIARLKSDPTYLLNVLDQAIPRSMYPEKSHNFSTLMTSWAFPDNFNAGVTGNFGFVSEFILYFGPAGVIAAGLFLGFLAYFCQRKFFKGTVSRKHALEYAAIVQPYFLAFPVAYINDGCLPTLLISILAWQLIRPIVVVGSEQSELDGR